MNNYANLCSKNRVNKRTLLYVENQRRWSIFLVENVLRSEPFYFWYPAVVEAVVDIDWLNFIIQSEIHFISIV
jgi:hypothetical protein